MKKVKLNQYTETPNGYCIFLGNGTRHYFSSERNAKRFLSLTATFLSRQLHHLHGIFCELLLKHKQSWFTLEDPVQERKIRELFELTEQDFRLCVNNCTHAEGNFFSFKHLFDAAVNMKNGCLMLSKISAKKSVTTDVYFYDGMLSRLSSIETELTKYSEATADMLMPLHNSIQELPEENVLTLKFKKA